MTTTNRTYPSHVLKRYFVTVNQTMMPTMKKFEMFPFNKFSVISVIASVNKILNLYRYY